MQFNFVWFIDLVTKLDNKLAYETLGVPNKLFITESKVVSFHTIMMYRGRGTDTSNHS